MEITPQLVLIVCAFIVIPVAVSFFFIRRAPQDPSKLNLKSQNNKDLVPMEQKANMNTRRAYYEERRREARREMSLNVLFNWNGFTWDAYEVLGVPAGSSKDTVTTAYQKARAQCDNESLAFFDAAYSAIKQTTSR